MQVPHTPSPHDVSTSMPIRASASTIDVSGVTRTDWPLRCSRTSKPSDAPAFAVSPATAGSAAKRSRWIASSGTRVAAAATTASMNGAGPQVYTCACASIDSTQRPSSRASASRSTP